MAESDPPSPDRMIPLIADERRRHALRCLLEHDALPLADLADEVAVRERGAPIGEIPAEDVKNVYMSLYHSHVPKLDEANVVTYDQETDAVALDEHADLVARYLDAFLDA
ncbi:hypothetical protein G9464_03620 [Halostella sp. JP-L12]|uniref:DUF7344 domain-containing protein n=1 Tax=Halostella TaxID=1843185 RepID=UPI000EF7D98D|nr:MULTISPECIES: hypothetical protein [Halostella]NHN46684.1 hypothetical protein [Halostella sp. JP-L12]